MTRDLERANAQRDCRLVDGGVEPAFDRLARLAAAVTRVPLCVIAFGTEPVTVKGLSGPAEAPLESLLAGPLYDGLLRGERPTMFAGDLAGAVILAPSGVPVGACLVQSVAPRVWTEDALDALSDFAALAHTELRERQSLRPDDRSAKILECISDACVFLDAGFHYTYVNAKAGEIFGRQPASLVGKHIWTEFPEGVGQRFDLAYIEAMSTQEPAFIEEYYPPWDRWFENRIYPSPDGLAIFFQDVTEKKHAEEQRAQEARLRTEAERMAHLGSWKWDVTTNHVHWSDELFRIYGISGDTSPASFSASFEGYLERVHPLDRTRVRETIADGLRNRVPFTFQERIVRPGGEIRHLNSWANVAVDTAGKPVAMYGACLDLTELTSATEGLRRTEAWLDAALATAGVAVWEWNVRTNEMRWSKDAEAVIGVPAGELRATFDAYLGIVHPDDRKDVLEQVRATVANVTPLLVEHRVERAGAAPRWFVVRGTPFPDSTGRTAHLVGAIVDATARHESDRERDRLLEEIRHKQRLDAVGRLAASVSHDFNNFLTIIHASADTLLAKPGLDDDSREAAQGIIRAAISAGALTRQLVAFSRRGKLSPAPLDLNAAVEGACRLLGRLLPDDVALVLSLGPGLGMVNVDRASLEQVLLNLVVNARDAMPKGGTLTIGTAAVGDHAELTIRDSGTGMTEDVKARVFEPFYTTKNDGRGTGLGLSIVRDVVTENNGTVGVESAPGRGATFVIRFPFVPNRA